VPVRSSGTEKETMHTILFVDDEPRVLDGLKRSLRSRRTTWTMHFAVGAREGLSLLDGTPVDVVVSDVRMPGMDGIEFLTLVRERFPSTSRIILSGYSERMSLDAANAVAERFLSKPCEARELIDAIEACLGDDP